MSTRDLSLRRGSETDRRIDSLSRELNIEDTAVIVKAVELLNRLVELRVHKDTRDLVVYDRSTGSQIEVLRL